MASELEITPVNGRALIAPILHSEARAKEVMDRSGLYLVKPDNKLHSFEGIPSQGIIRALPAEYYGPLRVGMRVVFSEEAPKGFKHNDEVLFPIDIDKIVAEVVNDDEPTKSS